MTWPNLPEWLVFSAADVAASLATWLVQSTVLILVGLSIARWLHHRGAALQSAVYRATLVGVLACPLASLVLAASGIPGWSWRVSEEWLVARGPDAHEALPASAALQSQEEPAPPAAPAVEFDQRGEASPDRAMMAYGGANGPFSDEAGLREAFAQPPEANDAAHGAVSSPEPTDRPLQLDAPNAVGAVPARPRPTGTALVMLAAVLVWIAGSAVLLGRLARASRGMRAVIRTSAPAGGLVSQAAREMAAHLGVRAPRVVVSPLVTSPCLYGILRPTLLLPEDAVPNDTVAEFARIPAPVVSSPNSPQIRLQPRLREIFAHELAHLRRSDCLWHLVHRLMTSILWPQPLAWLLARRLERAAEDVCDDYAMQHGADRTRYADTLVEIAERTLPPLAASASAVSMVSFRSTLAHRVLRVLDPTRRLSTRAGSLAVALVVTFALCGTLLVGLLGAASQGEAERPAATNDATDTPQHKPETGDGNSESKTARPDSASDEIFTIRGRVVDPDGDAAAGAMVRVLPTGYGYMKYPLLDETTTEEDGSFEVHFRKSQFISGVGHADPWRQAVVVAIQEGFGPAWTRYHEIAEVTEPTLQLARDDIPIEGRLVDLEGRPLAGVTVEAHHIRQPKEDDLSEWHVALQQGGMRSITDRHLGRSLSLEGIGILGPVRTDNDGRFRITGIGRERVAILGFHSDQAAYTTVHAATRHMEPVTQVKEGYFKDTQQYVGAEFSLSLPPTKPIHGTVRDAETGEPIAGVAVESWVMAGTHLSHNRVLRTVSDEEGRFALLGMPKGEGNEFIAIPNDDQPYFMRTVEVPDTEGLAPVRVDIELNRGIWITGRVTDQVTGEPLIAHLYYMPFLSNSHAQALPEFRDNSGMDGFQWRYESKPDGTFKIVGLPGPALVGAQSTARPYYRTGAGMEDLAADEVNEHGDANTWSPAIPASRKWPHVVKKINPPADAETAAVDLELDPGKSLTLVAVDPQGQPVEDLSMMGHLISDSKPIEGSPGHYRVMALGPDELRTAILLHSERGLGKVIRIDASQPLPEVLTVQLEPCATITGRLFDDDGVPIAAAAVRASVNPAENFPKGLVSTTTDSDGRFRYENVPVGCTYRLQASSTQLENGFDGVASEVEVRPGETTDLGDVTLGEQGDRTASDAPVEPVSAGRQSGSDQRFVYTGRVLTPSGEPAAGAKIHLVYSLPDDAGDLLDPVQPLAETDESGRFRFELNRREFLDTYDEAPWVTAAIVATKEGFGFGWLKAAALETTGNAAKGLSTRLAAEYLEIIKEHRGAPIQLVDDNVPLTGRIVDIDGQPVARAAVRVRIVFGNEEQDLSPLLEIARGEPTHASEILEHIPVIARGPIVGSILTPVQTDDDGRFTMKGIGRGRLAFLHIDGTYVETSKIFARTEFGERIDLPVWQSPDLGKEPYYATDFTYVAAPSRPVVGVVRDKDTRDPIPGIAVISQRVGNRYGQFVRTVTDDAGRYELHGLPLGESRIAVISLDGEPYLPYQQLIDTEEGQGPLQVDFKMQRGLWIEGTVRDATTGEPIPGQVWHSASDDNPNYDAEYYSRVDLRSFYRARTDGRFRIPGLPGRGLVRFIADRYERYPRGIGAETVTGPVDFDPLYCTAVQQIVPPADARTFEVSFELVPGRQLWGRVVGPEGEPVQGGYYIGVRDNYEDIVELPAWQEMLGDRFVIENYDPHKLDRILFYHGKLGLAGSVAVQSEAPGDITAKLQPAGTIRGRIVDENGEPQSHAKIQIWDRSLIRFGIDDPELLTLPTPLPPQPPDLGVSSSYDTDDEGRFEISGLVPGLPYNLAAMAPPEQQGRSILGQFAFDVTVESGEGKDLGDVTPKALKRPEPRDPQNADAERQANRENRAEKDGIAIRGRVVDEDAEDDHLVYSGRVLTPSGEPAAGAAIHFAYSPPDLAHDASILQPLAETAADGSFRIELKQSDFGETSTAPWATVKVIATNDGYGFGWTVAAALEKTGSATEDTDRLRDFSAARLRETLQARDGDTIRLVPDDLPVNGRIIDIEGRPVAGALVRLIEVWGNDDRDLAPFVETARAAKSDYYSVREKAPIILAGSVRENTIPSVKTDADGRFTLQGIGRGRIVQLQIGGQHIASSRFYARTQAGERIDVPNSWEIPDLGTATFYPVSFTHVAGPSRPVVGTIRDKETGQPVPGVTVASQKLARGRQSGYGVDFIRSVTDAKGGYELTGLPIGENRIGAIPPGEEPYLPVVRSADTRHGDAPLALDFELQRGVWITGISRDTASGEPLSGRVEYFTFLDNPHYDRGHFGHVDVPTRYRTDRDGRFRIPGLPGRGIIAFSADDWQAYPRGIGYESIDGADPASPAPFLSTAPTICVPGNFHVVKQIEPAPDAETVEVAFELRRGKQVRGKVVGPDGQPLEGAYFVGSTEARVWQAMEGNEFVAEGIEPGKRRHLIFYHQESGLAGSYWLERPTDEELTVKLQPSGIIRGRVVDAAGAPQPRVAILSWDSELGLVNPYEKDAELRAPLPPTERNQARHETDDEGRFEIRGLVPGLTYYLGALYRGQNRNIEQFAAGVTVEPGEVKDLGDLPFFPRNSSDEQDRRSDNTGAVSDADPPKPQGGSDAVAAADTTSQSLTTNATSADRITIRGRVVDPNGQPVAGASICVVRWYWNPLVKRTPLSETKTDRDGSFEIAYSKSDFQVDIGRHEQWREGLIVASKQGFGPAWISYSEIPAETEPTLQLVPDSTPIEGRLLDLEGRPLANVNVRVVTVDKPTGDDLSGWIDAVKDGKSAAQAAHGNIAFASIPDTEPSLLPEVRTNSDGRFQLRGIGAERRVTLEFSSPTIATTRIICVTRDMQPFTRVLTPAPYLKQHRVMGASFELTLPPTRPVQGVVRDAETGEPLPGVGVQSWRVVGNHFGDKHLVGTVTDEEGRYRLVGLPKGGGNGIIAVPNDDQPYFMRELDVPDTAGLEPVTLNIELHRGIWITGRVTEGDTGEPVIARLRYLPFRTNRYAQVLPEFGSGGNVDGYSLRRYESKPDGSFKLVGLPGPGVAAAKSTLDADYAFGVGFEDLKADEVDEEGRARAWRNGGWLSRKSDHALKRIEPPETANQVTIDFELQRGKLQRLLVVDPDGNSLDGLSTAGLLPRGDYLTEASGGSADARARYYTVSGLGPGGERTVVLLHEDRNLGKVLRIDAGAPLPEVRTVRLEPCATITGRLLGPDGVPLGGVRVNADVHPVEDFGQGLPYTETDTEGRFRYVNVPVGCTYHLSARGGPLDGAVEVIVSELAVEPGKTVDLGDIDFRHNGN